MKNKLIKILSVVSIVCLLVGCFAFSSSAASEVDNSVNQRASVPSSARWFYGKIEPDLQGALNVLSSYGMGSSYVPLFEFSINGIEFGLMQVTNTGIYVSGSQINLYIYTVDNGWTPGFDSLYVEDFEYEVHYHMLSYLFNSFTPQDYSRISSARVPSSCDIIIDNYISRLMNYFVGSAGSVVPSGNYQTRYWFISDVQGFFNFEGNLYIFDHLEFTFDPYSADSYLNFISDSSGIVFSIEMMDIDKVESFIGTIIHFYSIPSFLRDAFVFYSSYVILDFPYYVHNTYDLGFIDISQLTDLDTRYGGGGKIYFNHTIAFPDSYTGYPLDSYSNITVGGGLLGPLPNARYGCLYTPSGIDLTDCYIIPEGSISGNTCNDSFYFIFNKQCYYDMGETGIKVPKTFEYNIVNTELITSMFNRYDYLGNNKVICHTYLNGVYYGFVERLNDTFIFSNVDSPDTLTVSFADMVDYRITLLAGSTVSPVWYQFVALNGQLLIYGGSSGDYDSGYDAGFKDGQKYGESLGFIRGESEGYNRGFESAKKIYDSEGGGIIGKLLSAPGDAFDSLILYESEGITVSLWDVFTTLLCASLFVWFLKMFAGG